jgi:hypothetical protein
VKTDQQRKDGYTAKYVAATVALKVASSLTGMKSGFASAAQSLAPIEIQVQGILNAVGTIPTVFYPYYLNFARQIWAKHYSGIQGAALTVQAQALSTFYQAKGLLAPPLISIASDCFGLTVT